MINISFKTLMIIIFVLGLNACAHKRFTDNANSYLQEGRYELARQEFDQALALKPGDVNNQVGRRRAQQGLNSWLTRVQTGAESAYARGEEGKALLLYGKLLQLRKSPEARSRYQSLLTSLSESQLLEMDLIYNSEQFGADFDRSVRGLKTTGNSARAETLSLKIDNYRGKTLLEEKTLSAHYLAGIETLANPEFLHLQEIIHRGRVHLRDIRSERKNYRAVKEKLDRAITKQQQKIKLLEHSLAEMDPESYKYTKTKDSLLRYQAKLGKIIAKKDSNQLRLAETEEAYHRVEHRQEERLEQLSFLSPVIEREVYADYEYVVGEITQTMNADIHIRGLGRKVKKTATFVNIDTEHPAHPTINLAEKEANILSKARLRVEADREASDLALAHLEGLVAAHRETRLVEASRASRPAERFDLWVAYLVAGNQSSDPMVEADIRQHLVVEYGSAGEFPVFQLLNLYAGD